MSSWQRHWPIWKSRRWFILLVAFVLVLASAPRSFISGKRCYSAIKWLAHLTVKGGMECEHQEQGICWSDLKLNSVSIKTIFFNCKNNANILSFKCKQYRTRVKANGQFPAMPPLKDNHHWWFGISYSNSFVYICCTYGTPLQYSWLENPMGGGAW